MVENTTRYRIEELQDNLGNVIYPHTDARGVWVGEDSLQALLSAEITDEQISAVLNGQGGIS